MSYLYGTVVCPSCGAAYVPSSTTKYCSCCGKMLPEHPDVQYIPCPCCGGAGRVRAPILHPNKPKMM